MEKTTNKLVELDAVIDEIEEWYEMYPDSDTAREVLTLLKRSVKKLPTIDGKPEARWGNRWICSDMSGYEYACSCSKCGKPTYRISLLEKMPDYCQHCGAKMSKDE